MAGSHGGFGDVSMIIQIAIGFNCGFPQECATAPLLGVPGQDEMPAKRKSVVLFYLTKYTQR
jgi:hypothetical protein